MAKPAADAMVVFDLDACCWYPEMYMVSECAPTHACVTACCLYSLLFTLYACVTLHCRPDHLTCTCARAFSQLWGGGGPFKQDSTRPNNTLTDCKGTTVRLLADVAASWAELHRRMQGGQSLLVGIASRSDEPTWARECLRKFYVAEGVTMMDVVTEERTEIYKGSKRDHFKALQKKTNIPYAKMCFFDDDMANIRDVSGIGVHCFYTPDGVTRALFEQGLKAVAGGKDNWEAFNGGAGT